MEVKSKGIKRTFRNVNVAHQRNIIKFISTKYKFGLENYFAYIKTRIFKKKHHKIKLTYI